MARGTGLHASAPVEGHDLAVTDIRLQSVRKADIVLASCLISSECTEGSLLGASIVVPAWNDGPATIARGGLKISPPVRLGG